MAAVMLKSAWSSLKTRFSAHNDRLDRVHDLYTAIVTQARQAQFYQNLGVPDSLDGRFDLIVLHLHLVARKLLASGDQGKEIEQGLLTLFFADMDRSLREMGVGDLSVGKKIRNMAEAYYGRASAYDEALKSESVQPLQDAVVRNVYGGKDVSEAAATCVASYTRAIESEISALNAIDDVGGVKACFERASHHLTAHAAA